MFRIKGGTKQVITALCSTFDQEARVKLGHVVTSISTEKEEARVRVKTQNGSKKVTFSYTLNQLSNDYCLVSGVAMSGDSEHSASTAAGSLCQPLAAPGR